MRTVLLIALVALFQAPSPDRVVMGPADGVWEGTPKQMAIATCESTGSLQPISLAVVTLDSGALIGELEGFSEESRWRGRITDGKVRFEVPRTSTCGSAGRQYSLVLEGTIAEDRDGVKTMTLAGVDEPCSNLGCRFNYSVTLRWKKAVPVPVQEAK